NDMFGHEEGDFALCAIAQVLGEIIPDGVIARIGGDEYAFICGPGHFRKQLAVQITASCCFLQSRRSVFQPRSKKVLYASLTDR
ncbi:MAG: diguanylate cyclase, partial [Ruminiclostridium sp.]|nr:diguanylate cyclase [Ruminiclostridium sp.]